MKGFRVFAIAALLIACTSLGAYLVMNHRPTSVPSPKPSPRAEAPAETPTRTVKVYQVEVKDNEAKLHPSEMEIPADADPVSSALRKLFAQGDDGKLANPIPKGTKLLSLKVKKGLATVDLSQEFKDNFTGGSEQEGLTIGAVLRTLAQFPEIKQVQFLVEGKPLDSLGHLDLSGPQDVRWSGSQFGGDN